MNAPQFDDKDEAVKLLDDIDEFLRPRDDGNYEQAWGVLARMNSFLRRFVAAVTREQQCKECHDAAEHNQGCFRALKAERELAEAKQELNGHRFLTADIVRSAVSEMETAAQSAERQP